MEKLTIPYGSDVSAGTYQCNDCKKEISLSSSESIPPCPDFEKSPHVLKSWKAVSGTGDASKDPYPES